MLKLSKTFSPLFVGLVKERTNMWWTFLSCLNVAPGLICISLSDHETLFWRMHMHAIVATFASNWGLCPEQFIFPKRAIVLHMHFIWYKLMDRGLLQYLCIIWCSQKIAWSHGHSLLRMWHACCTDECSELWNANHLPNIVYMRLPIELVTVEFQ